MTLWAATLTEKVREKSGVYRGVQCRLNEESLDGLCQGCTNFFGIDSDKSTLHLQQIFMWMYMNRLIRKENNSSAILILKFSLSSFSFSHISFIV